MKTITIVVANGEASALDIPDGCRLRVVNTDDHSAPVKLGNGEVATVTELLPDSEQLKALHANSKVADGIPARPDIVYADEWQSWADFFGWVPATDAGVKTT